MVCNMYIRVTARSVLWFPVKYWLNVGRTSCVLQWISWKNHCLCQYTISFLVKWVSVPVHEYYTLTSMQEYRIVVCVCVSERETMMWPGSTKPLSNVAVTNASASGRVTAPLCTLRVRICVIQYIHVYVLQPTRTQSTTMKRWTGIRATLRTNNSSLHLKSKYHSINEKNQWP